MLSLQVVSQEDTSTEASSTENRVRQWKINFFNTIKQRLSEILKAFFYIRSIRQHRHEVFKSCFASVFSSKTSPFKLIIAIG